MALPWRESSRPGGYHAADRDNWNTWVWWTWNRAVFYKFFIGITHPRFTELHYLGEGHGHLHVCQVPQVILVISHPGLESSRDGLQFGFNQWCNQSDKIIYLDIHFSPVPRSFKMPFPHQDPATLYCCTTTKRQCFWHSTMYECLHLEEGAPFFFIQML